MNKKICYTVITGDYDSLKEPTQITKGWDYICFTENQKLIDKTSENWKFIKMGHSSDKSKHQRKKKIYNEWMFASYDVSVYVDGSMYINCDLNEFIDKNCKTDFNLMNHPSRNCIYQEAAACIMLQKDNTATIMQQTLDYKEEGLPNDAGMVATGVMIRRHTPEVIEFCRKWYIEILEHSKRDQLSFNYVNWKTPINYTTFDFNVLQKEFIITSHK